MLRLYSSPVVHCPALCPFGPPARLFRDDYDPGREETAEGFCLDRLQCRADKSRPCIALLRQRTAEAERRRSPSPSG